MFESSKLLCLLGFLGGLDCFSGFFAQLLHGCRGPGLDHFEFFEGVVGDFFCLAEFVFEVCDFLALFGELPKTFLLFWEVLLCFLKKVFGQSELCFELFAQSVSLEAVLLLRRRFLPSSSARISRVALARA
jgi:hypothetical protein